MRQHFILSEELGYAFALPKGPGKTSPERQAIQQPANVTHLERKKMYNMVKEALKTEFCCCCRNVIFGAILNLYEAMRIKE